MRKLLSSAFLIILSVSISHSQLLLSGKIFQKNNNQPLAYANIGIFDHNVGTLSNPDGTFELSFPDRLRQDTLQVSALGFEKISLPINTITDKRNIVVRLKERPVRLDPVVVNARKEQDI
ncbi:MAG TPA: carboxypeptidase-like regulatory domain-containing protein [Chryseosolibacter sp.]